MDDPVVEVRLLGRVCVTSPAEEVEPEPRTRGLLAVLALHPRGLERADLAALVAPDLEEHAARRRLSRLLWLLRTTVPALPVIATPRRVGLDHASCRVDVVEVEDLALRDSTAGDEAAFARIVGPFCPGSDLPWVLERRARLDELAARTGVRVAEARIARGDFNGAADVAERVQALQPSSAAAAELRMRAVRALGRIDEALAVYHTWCERWGGEPETVPAGLRDLAGVLASDRAEPPAEPGADAPPAAWLVYARHAGARGDQVGQRRALERLRSAVAAGELARSTLRITEIDAALDRSELELAEHLLAMGSQDRETVALVRRSRMAAAQGNLELAYQEASEALVGAYAAQSEEQRFEALLAFATATSLRGEGRDALAAATQARAAAERLGRLDGVLDAELLLGLEEIRQGHFNAAATRMTRVRERAAGAGLARVEGHAMRQLARARCRLGEFETADAIHQDERALWRRLGYPIAEAAAGNEHAYTLICMGRHDEVYRLTEDVLQLADRTGGRLAIAWAHTFRALALLCRDGLDERSAEATERAANVAESTGNAQVNAVATLLCACASYLRGEPAETLMLLERARSRYIGGGELAHMPVVFALEGLALLDVGEVDRALAVTTRGLTEVAQQSTNEFALGAVYAHTRVLEAKGQHDEARTWLARGIERLRQIAAKSGVSEAALARNDPLTRALAAEAVAAGFPIGEAEAPESVGPTPREPSRQPNA